MPNSPGIYNACDYESDNSKLQLAIKYYIPCPIGSNTLKLVDFMLKDGGSSSLSDPFTVIILLCFVLSIGLE